MFILRAKTGKDKQSIASDNETKCSAAEWQNLRRVQRQHSKVKNWTRIETKVSKNHIFEQKANISMGSMCRRLLELGQGGMVVCINLILPRVKDCGNSTKQKWLILKELNTLHYLHWTWFQYFFMWKETDQLLVFWFLAALNISLFLSLNSCYTSNVWVIIINNNLFNKLRYTLIPN